MSCRNAVTFEVFVPKMFNLTILILFSENSCIHETLVECLVFTFRPCKIQHHSVVYFQSE